MAQWTFRLDQPTKSLGWIIQQIDFEHNIRNCSGDDLFPFGVDVFWETAKGDPLAPNPGVPTGAGSWGIPPQSEVVINHGGFPYDDQFTGPEIPDSNGEFTATGAARFYLDITLEISNDWREFVNDSTTPSGTNVTLVDQPDFWVNPAPEGTHWTMSNWNCANGKNFPTTWTSGEN